MLSIKYYILRSLLDLQCQYTSRQIMDTNVDIITPHLNLYLSVYTHVVAQALDIQPTTHPSSVT